MKKPITLFTGQWADMSLAEICEKAVSFGYDGLELCCWGNHINVKDADQAYCDSILALLAKHNLKLYAISTHLVSQCVCDLIDERHKSILPSHIWGDGEPEGVRRRAAQEIVKTAEVARMLGVNIVNGFTGSSIWHMLYAFPPVNQTQLAMGYADFARRWKPIFDAYQDMGVKYALEVHPSEIAFDAVTAQRALEAVDYHPAFGFNYDPSHLGYQGVDYVKFIYSFANKIFHVHMKDVYWSQQLMDVGVFGGHTDFGDSRRFWNFRSLGRGSINFENIIRALNDINYQGPLSVEWEDSAMNREQGAKESCQFVRNVDFEPSHIAFDDAMQQ
jgi:sugar phosphate isomerase/epimerase